MQLRNIPSTVHPSRMLSFSRSRVLAHYAIPIRKRGNEPSVHLVDTLNVNHELKQSKSLYVFCDLPKVKDMKNVLCYTFLETRHGVLVSTNKDMLTSIKNYLDLPHYVVEVKRDDYNIFADKNNTPTIVLYNAYCDLTSESTYFLYFTL